MSDQHKQHDCPYCWRVVYSKGALTRHVNDEHWKELEAEQKDLEPAIHKLVNDNFDKLLWQDDEVDNEPA